MFRNLTAHHLSNTSPTAFWRSPELRRDAWPTLRWLSALAIVYWWTLTGLQAWLKPAAKLTGGHWWHLPALLVLAGLAFLLVRLAPERLAKRSVWQTAGGALGVGFLIIIAVPRGWNVLALLVLLASVFAWGAAPRRVWPRLLIGRTQHTEALMGVSFAVLEKISQRDWRQIETDFLKALAELKEIDNELATSGSQHAHWRDFLGSLSRHFAPLFGILSFRSNEEQPPELAWFMTHFPPFSADERTRYNSVAFYRNTVQQNGEAERAIQLLWLNAGLMLAERRPQTLPDTWLDLHLLRLPILLDPAMYSEKDNQTVANALEAVFEFGEQTELNLFQQNSWLAVLERMNELDDTTLAATVTVLDRIHPGHRRSFAPDAHAHTQEREDRLHALLKQLAAQGQDAHVSTEPATPEAEAAREERAERRLQVLKMEMLEAMAETNFCNEEDRYEQHIEHLLNLAVLQDIGRLHDNLLPILGELHKDVEEHGVQLGEFLPHLGRKFGPLIYTLNETTPHDLYRWLLDTAGHTELTLGDSEQQCNLFLRLMFQLVVFHNRMARGDQPAAFSALTHYTLLLAARYPLCRLGFESGLVTGMEMLAKYSLPAEQIETFFVLFTEMPKRYAHLATDKQDALQELVKQTTAYLGLLDQDTLPQAQRTVLAEWMAGVEDIVYAS